MPKIIIPNFLNARSKELSATKKIEGNNTNYKLYLNSELIFDYDILKGEDSSKEYYKGIQCSLVVNIINDLLNKETQDTQIEKPEPKKPVQDPNVLHMTVKPEIGEDYYWIGSHSGLRETWAGNRSDLNHFDRNDSYTSINCGIAISIIKAKVELQNIASELNDGREIDWSDGEQLKYHIYLGHYSNYILQSECFFNQYSCIYCLEESFLEVAQEKMGEANLKLALGIWK